MARDGIGAQAGAEFLKKKLAPIGLVELHYDSGVFRMGTFLGRIAWDGNTWTGSGGLGRIGPIEETSESRAAGVELTLSGIGADVIKIAHREPWQGRRARIYYAVLDDANRFVGEPFQLRHGIMDVMTLTEGDKAEISLQIESRDIDQGRNKARRYTAEDQRAEYPDDAGCDQVPALQEKVIVWNVA